MGLTLLHFANLRLGTTFTALGIHGREHRAQLLTTLATLGDVAAVEQVTAVLISGDLFDSAVPAPSTLKGVQSFFARLSHAGIAAVVLPGQRDPDGVFNPARQADNREYAPGAVILGPGQTTARLEQAGLLVRALSLPAEGEMATAIPRVDMGMLTVGLAYRPAGHNSDLAAIGRSLNGAGIRYLGLGGDPIFALHHDGESVICSPGAPEPLEWGQERGSVALVRIADDGAVRVERRRTGSRSFARRELAVTPENARSIRQVIGRLAHGDLALEVVLTGTCPSDAMIDPAQIESDLAPHFFHLRVVDRTRLAMPVQGLGAWPQGTVVGNFARVMDGRIRDAADEEHATYDREAYQIGMSLLQGGSNGA